MNSSDVVLLHVSGGRELALKPGLNIICMLQPLGPRLDMSAMPDIVAIDDTEVLVADSMLIREIVESAAVIIA